MKKVLLILLTCTILLSGCTGAASSAPAPAPEPLDLPVAKVSAEYAEDAMGILNSFYDVNMRKYISEETIKKPVLGYDGSEYQVVEGWCYEPGGIDYYFYTWDMAIDAMRSGKTMGEMLQESDKSIKDFYHGVNLYLLLSQEGKVMEEAGYGGVVGDTRIFSHGHKMPTASLFLDDTLMKALKEEGFDTSVTVAESMPISGHSIGIYFSDGTIERYYPQGYSLDGMEEVMELYVFYTPEEFVELLNKGGEIMSAFVRGDRGLSD